MAVLWNKLWSFIKQFIWIGVIKNFNFFLETQLTFLENVWIGLYIFDYGPFHIEDKKSFTFIKFDIREFYPSITETILDKALLFAKQHHDIANDNKRLIKYCRKFLLFSNNEAWKKKQTESCFRVTIGSFDGAEVCKLVGIYTWCFLAKLIDKNDCGLYRNARLLTLRNVNGQEIDQMRKKYHKIIQRYWTCHWSRNQP